MATAAVTYTFVNGQAADGPQVNTNFANLVSFLNAQVVHVDGSKAMTGALVLPSDPTTALQAATKQYVDAKGFVPAGTIIPVMFTTGAGSEPTGWLYADGRNVSRTTYATLFAAIGTLYGAGDGSTTFGLPNLTDRVLVGKGSSFATLGAAGGSKDATLPTHSHGGASGTGGTHGHTGYDGSTVFAVSVGGPQNDQLGQTTPTNDGLHGSYITYAAVSSGGSHSHTVAAEGSSASYANMPPYITVNWLIRT